MSTIKCHYNSEEHSYLLDFISQKKSTSFSSKFIIKTPEEFDYIPVKSYEGFIFAVIFKAMECGEDLIIDLPLSPKGIHNINYLIEAWHNYFPKKYKRIKLIANNIDQSIKPKNNEAISAFSGGVDACFTLLRHNQDDWEHHSSFQLKNVLCVQGFDVPSDKNKEYQELLKRISPIFKQFNCQKLEVWTDLKEVSNQDWEMSHACQLACCFHLFSEHFDYALIGSGDSYKDLVTPWGSTPCTDFLLSSSTMETIHDGAGYTRTEKVKRISNQQIIRERLKVCWEKGLEDNCGECEKCYRTRFNFLAAGYADPKCFDTTLDLKKLHKFDYRAKSKLIELESILDFVQENNIKEPWVKLLKQVIWKNKIKAIFKKS